MTSVLNSGTSTNSSRSLRVLLIQVLHECILRDQHLPRGWSFHNHHPESPSISLTRQFAGELRLEHLEVLRSVPVIAHLSSLSWDDPSALGFGLKGGGRLRVEDLLDPIMAKLSIIPKIFAVVCLCFSAVPALTPSPNSYTFATTSAAPVASSQGFKLLPGIGFMPLCAKARPMKSIIFAKAGWPSRSKPSKSPSTSCIYSPGFTRSNRRFVAALLTSGLKAAKQKRWCTRSNAD